MKLAKLLAATGMIAAMTLASGIIAMAAEDDPASDATVSTQPAVVATMDFTGTSVKLSLKDAILIMQTTGSAAQTAEINKKSADATARGYDETYDSIRQALKDSSSLGMDYISQLQSGGVTQSNKQISELSRNYAKEQGPRNYEAEMNSIESTTVQTYYGVLQAQDGLKIAKDNLKVQQDLLTMTQKKFNLGMVAKKDVLSAETAVTTAKTDVAAAETALKNAKMNFNFMLGYPLMQEVILTDNLQQVSAPAITLGDAIDSALANRSEIQAADFAVKVNDAMFTDLKYRYPDYSATYLKQYVSLLNAQKSYDDSFIQIEMDIRAKYMGLSDKKNAIASAKATADNAAEVYRLANISYNSGMNTLNDVQQAQLGVFNANQRLSAAILDYDLAVYNFTYAVGVGTATMPL